MQISFKNLLFITLLFIFIAPFTVKAQLARLNKTIQLDTLRISMEFAPSIHDSLVLQFGDKLNAVVDKFNKEEYSYFLQLDTTKVGHWLGMRMEDIRYNNKTGNIVGTGLGLGFIAGHAYLISAIGYTFPLFLIPTATVAPIYVETSKQLYTNKKEVTSFTVNPDGYLRRIDKQNEKLVKKFNKTLFKYFKNLHQQNKQNKKRAS